MGFAFIREGDTTSHGGRVLACDPTNAVDGKALARVAAKDGFLAANAFSGDGASGCVSMSLPWSMAARRNTNVLNSVFSAPPFPPDAGESLDGARRVSNAAFCVCSASSCGAQPERRAPNG